MQQHELVAAALDLDDGQKTFQPAFVEIGRKRRAAARCGECDQRIAVRLADRDRRDRRLERQVVEIGGAPNGTAAAPMRDLAGIDRHHADGTERMEVLDPLAHDHAAEQHDLALHVGHARRRIVVIAEHHRALRAIALWRADWLFDEHQRRGRAVRHRPRHRGRARMHTASVGFDIAELRYSQIQLGLMHGDRNAAGAQPLDQRRDCTVALGRALAPDGREQLDHRPCLVERRRCDQRGFVFGHGFTGIASGSDATFRIAPGGVIRISQISSSQDAEHICTLRS